jgi:hypothetical protein
MVGILKEVKEALNIVTPALGTSQSTINLIANSDTERKFLILDLSRVCLASCLRNVQRSSPCRCLESMLLLYGRASLLYANSAFSQFLCMIICTSADCSTGTTT